MVWVWYVNGINGIAKREEVVDVSRKGKFEMVALSETKLKGNREMSWCGVKGIIVGIQANEMNMESMAV